MSSFLAPLHGESVLAWYEKKHKKWGLFGGKAEAADQGDSTYPSPSQNEVVEIGCSAALLVSLHP